jgi:quercetin dioxygenase-like cupin family protein
MEKDNNGNITLSELGKPKRYVTDHDEKGESIFSTAFDEHVTPAAIPGTLLYDVFTLTQSPAQLNGNADIEAMKSLTQATGLHREGATVMRFVDFLPGAPAVMHRTVSIDFGVLIFGELELTLDSGETKLLKPGDTVVQRGTNHAWRNPHPTETARALFVLAPIVPLVVNGEQLKEHIEWPES